MAIIGSNSAVGYCMVYRFVLDKIGSDCFIWFFICWCVTINAMLSPLVAQCPITANSSQLSLTQFPKRIWYFCCNKIKYRLFDRAVPCLCATTQWLQRVITLRGQSMASYCNCKNRNMFFERAVIQTWHARCLTVPPWGYFIPVYFVEASLNLNAVICRSHCFTRKSEDNL
jgi:hypothetical protein